MAKKLQYKIGDACKQLEIQPYVLRYWETEFPFLNPSKSRSGQRVYGAREMKVIARIKELLYAEGYTIAGAKKKLEAELEGGGEPQVGKGDGEKAASPQAGASAAEVEAERARNEELRTGISDALDQARAILGRLG